MAPATGTTSYTPSSAAALQHLQRIRPGDGWSLQQQPKDKTLKLLRRSVPLTDNAFVDLHVDGDGEVVGILSVSGATAQAQVLVDAKGQPVRGIRLKTVPWKNRGAPQGASSDAAAATSASRASSSTSSAPPSGTPSWTPEQHRQLWQLVGGFLAAVTILRLLVQTALLLSVLALPLLYLYLASTCPPASSFEAKKELKRVLRGHHLPDHHPDKPKGWLGEAVARINATVATELATGLGYEETVVDLAGAIRVACVRVPAAKMDFYWVGALHTWYYVYSNEIVSDKRD